MSQKRYYLYIDDSGSRFPDDQAQPRKDGMNHFALGGILIAEEDKEQLRVLYKEFCKKWDITYPLHSTEIRGKRGKFSWLEGSAKTNEKFLVDLEIFLSQIPVIGFAAVVNRDGYNARYKEKYGSERWWMCKTAFSILIERVTKYMISQEGVLEVRFERAGKKEDRAMIKYARIIKKEGLPFSQDASQKYQSLSEEDFQRYILGEPRGKTKMSIFIQIADLYLYPMVKRKYDPLYRPWQVLYENKKVIDSLISDEEREYLGIKYSCFDEENVPIESKNLE